MLGEGNFLARAYQGAPIAITVEGANILTRSMMIFGQGAIRCHPYVLEEMAAAQNNDLNAYRQAAVQTHRPRRQQQSAELLAGPDRAGAPAATPTR